MTSPSLSFPSLLLLATGLAMDAMAVAAARGLAVPRLYARHVVVVAAFFGGFQALMPLVGWLLGAFVGARIGTVLQDVDHWIAFALLAGLGGKMLWEARGSDEDDDDDGAPDPDPFRLRVMLALAVATSIDALAVGITLPMLGAELVAAVVTIGVTTAVLSSLGLFLGRRFGAALGSRLDVAGGLVLIGLGAKILLEHLLG
jgi:putative Mn2+ efflux pump MntP